MGCWRFQTASCCICWQKTISEHCCTVDTQCVTICDRQTKVCTFEYSRQMSKMASNAAQWQSCDRYRWPCPAAFTWLVHLCTVLSKAQPTSWDHKPGNTQTCVCVVRVCVVAWNASLELGESTWQVLIVTSVVEAIPKHSYCKGYTRFCSWQKMLSGRGRNCKMPVKWICLCEVSQVQKCSCTL